MTVAPRTSAKSAPAGPGMRHTTALSARPLSARCLAGEKGSVTAELTVATPLLLLMILAVVQAGLWSHATHIAQAAAVAGLADLRVEHGTETGACAHTRRLLDQLGHGPLTVTDVSCTRTATVAVVEVHGGAASLLPLLTLPVTAHASGPVERFVPDVTP